MPPTPRVHNYRLFVLPRRSPTFRTMITTARSSTAAPKAPTTPTSVFSSSGTRFELSPLPSNPLGEGRWIKTAGALIIGDEVLNGKTLDRNSNYFARYCFENGIELKRIEVIPDEEDEIIEASRRMVQKYDFVITTGGIGPTHDDITYASLAKAFNQPLVHHAETLHRMTEMSKHRSWVHTQDEEQRRAREKMALFPADAETLFVASDIWVPVIRLERKLCVFPGIPSLFQKMLDGLKAFLPLPPSSERPFRHQIFTSLPESSIAPYLTSLQERVKEEGIRVGSYPLIRKGVYVSLIGQNEDRIRELGKEVEVNIQGRVVTEQEIREAKGTSSNL
ncbi:MoaB/Mog domain-containing protein [Lactarius akahatsu]|uniref:MoaB/Mog domain-containing protein n=1 Tax=Lactarius akahatsu TaxID=416441 RepID=A0AAD4LH43_9AGAM|nr:MoaB/Mog domain-containing protein [Lactarius akahatsu]